MFQVSISNLKSSMLSVEGLISSLGLGNLIATTVILFLVLVNVVVYKLHEISEASNDEKKTIPPLSPTPASTPETYCRLFSFQEMKLATQNFSEIFVIGKGGFGKVYKGLINNGTEVVAIKRLSSASNQGKNEFWMEIETLCKLRHVHLVSLIGYCNESEEMLLVYEYMPQGTLADHLYKFKGGNNSPLQWEKRLKICIGAARGLDYLHTGFVPGIIHRDVKDTNILLAEKFVAKITDFGLAKLENINQSQSYVSTNVKGTFGYLDPEYFLSRRLSKKSDVYAFGVVLLVVLSGRPAVDLRDEEDKHSLVIWARQCIREERVDEIIDKNLRGHISQESLKAFIQVTKRCLHPRMKGRPSMSHIVARLEQALEEQQKQLYHFLPPCDKVVGTYVPSPEESRQGYISPFVNLIEFEFSELEGATKNFCESTLLGEGGFGKVYRGLLENRETSMSVVAIKRLSGDSVQGFEQWQEEFNFVGRLFHPNLVKLLGYCWEGQELLLVLEFMTNGSLDSHLFHRSSFVRPLPWRTRLKILIGAARILVFLHATKKSIYGDIKSSNILLDEHFNAKLSGLGLAKLGLSADESQVSTRMMGPQGYVAPEYFATGRFYEKSDVYSFGVVMVETLTGLRVLDSRRPKEQEHLIDWIRVHLSKNPKFKHIMDPRLKGIYPPKAVSIAAQTALRCIEYERQRRPTMEEVLEKLEHISKFS